MFLLKRLCWLLPVSRVVLVAGAITMEPSPEHRSILKQVDILERVYVDQSPELNAARFNVARGGNAFFQFVLTAGESLRGKEVSFELSAPANLPCIAKAHVLKSVPVEANSAGCSKSGIGVVPPPDVLNALVRESPFDVYEVLTEDESVVADGRDYYAVVVRVQVSKDAELGTYIGDLHVKAGSETLASAPLSLKVFSATLPEKWTLESTHWLWPEPENLTTGDAPEWWSEGHWALLAAAGKTLHS
ncbi:MAG: hypothetical protein WCG03_10245, partial [Kiritimatiellales bacterium]